MDSDKKNYTVLMMVNCHFCDKLAKDRCHKNHLKSQTDITIFRKRQQLKNTTNSKSHS